MIRSPGIDYQEIDRSNYGNRYRPLIDTKVFATGFTDIGDDYSLKYLTSMNAFIKNYGYPTNEAERYFFNLAKEVFGVGGSLIAARLPYNNFSKDKFTWCAYKLGIVNCDTYEKFPSLLSTDDTIKTYFNIESVDSGTINGMELSDLIDLETYDDYITETKKPEKNSILIINKKRNRYTKDPNVQVLPYVSTETSEVEMTTDAYLGIVPVLVSPLNAMMYQEYISATDKTNLIESLDTITPNDSTKSEDNQNLFKFDCIKDHLAIDLNGNKYVDSIERRAVEYFPKIQFKTATELERNYMKHIGVVVFKMIANPSEENKIDFVPIEAFIGSLDKTSKNSTTGASQFIDDIINSRSAYINFFSNFIYNDLDDKLLTNTGYKKTNLNKNSTILIENQTIKSLGFYESYCEKNISEEESIFKPLESILDRAKDPITLPIDIVCDAGVSNIAQYVHINEMLKRRQESESENPEEEQRYDYTKYDPTYDIDGEYAIQFTSKSGEKNESTSSWKKALTMFDEFARYTRKDCIFVADGLRTLCLRGNAKIVRKTAPKNTIEKHILPNIKELIHLNSSYSAGYCDWFRCYDSTSRSMFWCPPSIKAVGKYLFCDRYHTSWSAPAGENYGRITDAYDVAFSPTQKESEVIYTKNWNYAIAYPLKGIMLEGQKTFQKNKTALDRINVRRLCLKIKRDVSRIANEFKYEGITQFLLDSFRQKMQTYLDEVKYKNGISDYKLILDGTNNTPETIDRNEIHVAFAIRPIKTAEFIIMRSVIVNQTANIEEVASTYLG